MQIEMPSSTCRESKWNSSSGFSGCDGISDSHTGTSVYDSWRTLHVTNTVWYPTHTIRSVMRSNGFKKVLQTMVGITKICPPRRWWMPWTTDKFHGSRSSRQETPWKTSYARYVIRVYGVSTAIVKYQRYNPRARTRRHSYVNRLVSR